MAAFGSNLPVVDVSGSFLDRVLRSLRSLRSLARCARLTIMEKSFWKPLGIFWKLFRMASYCFKRFRSCSLKLFKHRRPSFQNHPQNHPESTRKPPKIRPKTLQKLGLEGIVLRIAFGLFFSRICGRLGPSRAPLGTILEPSWGVWRRLGAVLARPRGGLGPSLGASWERFGASWKRFGTISTKKCVF